MEPQIILSIDLIKTTRFLRSLQQRLNKITFDGWKIEEQIDWHVVRAEMNGYDFNYRVLRPWERDPAFYQTIWTYKSDVPAHEGPTNHATLELWTYSFPLQESEQARLIKELGVVSPLLKQARKNLTGNARDLWIAGTNNFYQQKSTLERLAKKIPENNLALQKSFVRRNTRNYVLYILVGRSGHNIKTGLLA